MCSGSDEHGTPITITAEQQGVSPQEIVNKYHDLALDSLTKLGCAWSQNIDSRGIEYGGAYTTEPQIQDIRSWSAMFLPNCWIRECYRSRQ